MPRAPRLDYPGALHHVLCRGIERRSIFRTDRDRAGFLDRLGELVVQSRAGLYALSLMPNHAHVLLRTGTMPLSRLAQRWLGPYASRFNLAHRRTGHLFPNRFKNTLVAEAAYLCELIRYIHLNPVRSRLAVTIETLDTYPWTGHAVLLGSRDFPPQDTRFVLEQFGDTVERVRSAYRAFVRAAVDCGPRRDLDGGGLRRSAGGWEPLPTLRRGRERWEFDERILGSSRFVSEVIARLGPDETSAPALRASPVPLDELCHRLAAYFAVTPQQVRSPCVHPGALDARALLSQAAVSKHALSMTATARYLRVSRRSVTRALTRAPAVLAAARSTLGELIG